MSVDVDRRRLLGATLMSGVALSLATRAAATDPAATETIALWPGAPPGGGASNKPERIGTEGAGKGAISGVDHPRLRVYRPARANGTAILVIAGGGYFRTQLQNESAPMARWLAARGITAFELIYRMPGDGWSRDAAFADAQRAMRLIRAGAATYGIDPKKIGVVGFSAGGHLAAMTAAAPDAAHYAAVDAVDTQPVRPDFTGLLYPVITLKPPFDTTRSKFWLIGEHPSAEETRAWSVETHVGATMPPVFVAQNADDPIAPVDNSLLLFDACRKAKVPCEMHIFEEGGHGFGLGKDGSTDVAWPELFAGWLKKHRLL